LVLGFKLGTHKPESWKKRNGDLVIPREGKSTWYHKRKRAARGQSTQGDGKWKLGTLPGMGERPKGGPGEKQKKKRRGEMTERLKQQDDDRGAPTWGKKESKVEGFTPVRGDGKIKRGHQQN